MDATPLRVTLIEIEGLFRRYNHHIPLQQEDRVTILHGRNGTGKTITLSLVAALLEGNDGQLRRFPFRKLRIEFSDGSYIESRPGDHGEPIECGVAGREKTLFRRPESEPLALVELRTRVPVHFIEAQRLVKIGGLETRIIDSLRFPSVTPAVQDVAGEMVKRIQETDAEYRAVSTHLDNSLTARLFDPMAKAVAMPEDELIRRTQALEEERRRLHEIGLIAGPTAFIPGGLDETQLAMFAVVLRDNEKKLSVFKKLAEPALTLCDILNRKFAPKQLKLDKDTGYKAFSHDGQELKLEQLSSGEQHELVLLHNLLFRVEQGALLLIDEPELSLHVTWQTEFLSDLIMIAKTVGFDAVVATHSPYIVGSRRDLMVQLGEPV